MILAVVAGAAALGGSLWGYMNHGPPPPALGDRFGLLRTNGELAAFACIGEPGDGIHNVVLTTEDGMAEWRARLADGSATDVVPITDSVPSYEIATGGRWSPTGTLRATGFGGERGGFSWYVQEFDTDMIDDGSALTADGEIIPIAQMGARFPQCELPSSPR